MKNENIERNIQRSGNFEERAMGLAVGSEAFVFNVLRKDLYSDPIGSLIREYTVNAQDEHRKHNKTDVPIYIQAPSTLSPELHIRDYAGGLTEEQVFEFFGNYGASDKRDSNEAVGFFGLGCKSAFAYTDSYVVKSFKDGKVFTFNIYLDETEIGKVAKISEEDTDEPNGVLVLVPVKTNDIYSFQKKVINTVQYFKTTPVIEGLGYEPDFEKREAKIEGDGWKFFGSGSTVCLMGEIAYPIDTYSINGLESWERNLLDSGLHIVANIGDVQVTASREALQMSEKTVKVIRAKLVEIRDTMVEETEKAFAEAKTLFEAKSLYYTLISKGGGFGRIIRESGVDLLWNGTVIQDNYIKLDVGHWVTHYSRTYKGKIKDGSTSILKCGEDTEVYFDDIPVKAKLYKRRADTLLQGDVRQVVFVHTTDKKDLEKVIGMPVGQLNSLEAVVPMPVNNISSSTGIDLSKRTKHMAKVFQLNLDSLRGYRKSASEVWEIKEIDTRKGGIYVPIHRFQPQTGLVTSLDGLSDVLYTLQRLGVKTNAPIYGVKGDTQPDKMIKFEDWVSRKVNALTEVKQKMGVAVSYDGYAIDLREMDADSLINEDTKEYISSYREVRDVYRNWSLRDTARKAFRWAGLTVEPTKNLTAMSEKIAETYPLLPLIDSYRLGEQAVIDYMNDIDEKNFLTNVG